MTDADEWVTIAEAARELGALSRLPRGGPDELARYDGRDDED
jgi:hypothetical protein